MCSYYVNLKKTQAQQSEDFFEVDWVENGILVVVGSMASSDLLLLLDPYFLL